MNAMSVNICNLTLNCVTQLATYLTYLLNDCAAIELSTSKSKLGLLGADSLRLRSD